MKAKQELPRNQQEMRELLKRNLEKVAEAASVRNDPVELAYLAGRMDGLADMAWIKERSA